LAYSSDVEQAAKIARAAIEMMDTHAIAAHPNNYEVWFNYCAEAIPELKRALDILIDNKQEFTESQNMELYRRFLTSEEDASSLNAVAHNLEVALNNILGVVDQAGADTREYGEVLEHVSTELSGKPSSKDFQSLVDNILNATRRMQSHNQELEKKLNSTSQEISSLRQEVETSRREASTDALTGISNRKRFDARLREAAAEAMENGDDLSLLMLDIDHFKKFNDEHGHQVGDQVLVLLARTLMESIKGQDTAARYGGEEFAVILPKTGLVNAVALADQIRTRLANKKIVNRKTGKQLGTITLSIGVAKFVYGEPLTQLISRADGAMYVAKKSGRNQVRSEDDIQPSEVAVGS
jgi:diguanylate cyclase